MSRRDDSPNTVGEIIFLALERRNELVPRQKALESIASTIGVDPRTLRRWIDNEGKPDLTQFGAILDKCDYPEGWTQMRSIHFPNLK